MLIGLILLALQVRAAPDTALQPTAVIEGQYSQVYVDNLQNMYLVSAGTGSIKKLDNRGDSAGVFNSMVRYGKPHLLDVSNPLKLLLYYKDFATILLLDRFLSLRATIDLRRLGIMQVKAVAQSYDGNIWLYDELEGRIKKLDESGNLLLQSADLRLVFDDALSPEKMVDNNGQLYLYDGAKGWLIFDYYTAFKKLLPFTNWQDVQVQDGVMSGRGEGALFFTTAKDIDYLTVSINIEWNKVKKISWHGQKLYVLGTEGVGIYNGLQLPF